MKQAKAKNQRTQQPSSQQRQSLCFLHLGVFTLQADTESTHLLPNPKPLCFLFLLLLSRAFLSGRPISPLFPSLQEQVGTALNVHQTVSPWRIQEGIHQSEDQNAPQKGSTKKRLPTTTFSYKNVESLGIASSLLFCMVYILTKVSRILNFTF